MNNTAYQIWETFKAGLKDEPTDDMKQALGNAIRVISSHIYRDGVLADETWHFYIAQELNEYADELEAL